MLSRQRAELQGKLDSAQAEISDLESKLSNAETKAVEARQEAGKHADDKEEFRRKLERTASEVGRVLFSRRGLLFLRYFCCSKFIPRLCSVCRVRLFVYPRYLPGYYPYPTSFVSCVHIPYPTNVRLLYPYPTVLLVL